MFVESKSSKLNEYVRLMKNEYERVFFVSEFSIYKDFFQMNRSYARNRDDRRIEEERLPMKDEHAVVLERQMEPLYPWKSYWLLHCHHRRTFSLGEKKD